MNNETFDPMFEIYIKETLPDQPPLADQIASRHQVRLRAQQDRLQNVERDGDAPVFANTLDHEEHFARERINKAIRTGIPEPPALTRSLPADLADEELRKALGVDEIVSPIPLRKAVPSSVSFPRLVDARSMGRGPLPPGPALLDKPISDILERVAERSTTERTGEFARKLAERARALENIL
jgi:hypothetical protein